MDLNFPPTAFGVKISTGFMRKRPEDNQHMLQAIERQRAIIQELKPLAELGRYLQNASTELDGMSSVTCVSPFDLFADPITLITQSLTRLPNVWNVVRQLLRLDGNPPSSVGCKHLSLVEHLVKCRHPKAILPQQLLLASSLTSQATSRQVWTMLNHSGLSVSLRFMSGWFIQAQQLLQRSTVPRSPAQPLHYQQRQSFVVYGLDTTYCPRGSSEVSAKMTAVSVILCQTVVPMENVSLHIKHLVDNRWGQQRQRTDKGGATDQILPFGQEIHALSHQHRSPLGKRAYAQARYG
jgi:hypothetical protein